MRQAIVLFQNKEAGILTEKEDGFEFTYLQDYNGQPVSLTMPTSKRTYRFDGFPPFFEGLLPEGVQLDALLRSAKIDRKDYFGQLITVGSDLVGAVSLRAMK